MATLGLDWLIQQPQWGSLPAHLYSALGVVLRREEGQKASFRVLLDGGQGTSLSLHGDVEEG